MEEVTLADDGTLVEGAALDLTRSDREPTTGGIDLTSRPLEDEDLTEGTPMDRDLTTHDRDLTVGGTERS